MNIKEQFLEFQSKHFDITDLQKRINTSLHKLDNEITDIQNDEHFDKEKGQFYEDLLIKHFTELFTYYKTLFD